MNGLGDDLRDRANAIAERAAIPLRMTGVGSLVGVHFTGAVEIRSTRDLDGDSARERAVSDIQRLLHFDLLQAGHYAARRGYLALSLCTTTEQTEALVASFQEFAGARGDMVRDALDQAAG